MLYILIPTATANGFGAHYVTLVPEHELPTTAPILGPAGPPQALLQDDNVQGTPSSPHTSQRVAIRNLTLPTIPNFDVPSSPPGSPTSADQKFAHFQDLKQQGIHFNAKLASSSSLKNPSILPKLMEATGAESSKQYATTLPLELWNPFVFPEWGFIEGLAKSQQEISKEIEKEKGKTQREKIGFVSAGDLTTSNRDKPPGHGIKPGQGSAVARVMTGFDKEKKA